MTKNDYLIDQLKAKFAGHLLQVALAFNEVTIECDAANVKAIMLELEIMSFFRLIN